MGLSRARWISISPRLPPADNQRSVRRLSRVPALQTADGRGKHLLTNGLSTTLTGGSHNRKAGNGGTTNGSVTTMIRQTPARRTFRAKQRTGKFLGAVTAFPLFLTPVAHSQGLLPVTRTHVRLPPTLYSDRSAAPPAVHQMENAGHRWPASS